MPLFTPVQQNWYLAHPALLTVEPAGSSTRTANSTYLHDVWCPYNCVITSLAIAHGATVGGNFDLGIYDATATGNLLTHIGVTSAATFANATQNVNLASPFFLPAGKYMFAFWVDNALDTYFARTSLTPTSEWGVITGSVGTNAGGLASNYAGMGGVTANATFVPFLGHIQGSGF